jgi:hypothetical protein
MLAAPAKLIVIMAIVSEARLQQGRHTIHHGCDGNHRGYEG